jgi:ABC-type Zn uptake system ZnuABC Zn-binding protein ZnuA
VLLFIIDDRAEEHHEADHDREESEHHGKAEHDTDHHEHAGLDPHIWLSPPLVKIQARTILAALQEADPVHRSIYEANFKAFTTQIDQLDADLKKTFAGKTGLQFMVFHPSWGYFAHAYGLKQVPIEIKDLDVAYHGLRYRLFDFLGGGQDTRCCPKRKDLMPSKRLTHVPSVQL